jgi:hypothetical protein
VTPGEGVEPTLASNEFRGFLARILGWRNVGAVDRALRSIHLGVTHQAALVPPLRERAGDLKRIVDEYARDAIAALRAPRAGFTNRDRAWILQHRASSLSEIEKATLRLVAIRASRSISAAAARLGMAPVSLLRWIGHRRP